MEPLATVASLERHLLKMVAKQWYDFDRSTFAFLKRLKNRDSTVTLKHENDFDDNGLMYWLGTNGRYVFSCFILISCRLLIIRMIEQLSAVDFRSRSEWVNPAAHGIVVISSSDGRQLPYGKLEDILSRDSSPLNCHTNDDRYVLCYDPSSLKRKYKSSY